MRGRPNRGRTKLVLEVRISAEERAFYRQQAAKAGLRVADWVRQKLQGKAKMPTLTKEPTLAKHSVGELAGGESLSEAIRDLPAPDGMELSIEGIAGAFKLGNRREIEAFATGLEVGGRRESQFENALSAIEVVLLKAKQPGVKVKDVFADGETIRGYLNGCGSLRERCAKVLTDLAEFLG